ncbi:MAG: tRNA lysidine(34) synthetase TilS [Pseudomonadota bacterium]|nr:tRNA lysidine(34) synthetase TilS [Pseudomonadota bacterium]
MNISSGICSTCTALNKDEFDQLMEAAAPFCSRDRVAVAVSGGPDSTALLLLLRGWTVTTGRSLIALTVNHDLRTDAAKEAEQVANWCKKIGIEHQILRWTGKKPETGLQAAARKARYRLMEHWCRENGVGDLCVGHTQNDQVETFLFRMSRGSGPDGLAAMPLVAFHGDIRIVRPLLTITRSRINATLDEAAQPSIEDPMNADRRYARTVIRHQVERLQKLGVSLSDVAVAARLFGEVRTKNETATSDLYRRIVVLHSAGYADIDATEWRDANAEVASRLIAALIQKIGGGDYFPRRERLERIVNALERDTDLTRTLGGCKISARGEVIRVQREHRAIRAKVSVAPGGFAIWDGRFELEFSKNVQPRKNMMEVRALGEQGWQVLVTTPSVRERIDRYRNIPVSALYALPAVWGGEMIAEVPHLSYSIDETIENIVSSVGIRRRPPLESPPFWVA